MAQRFHSSPAFAGSSFRHDGVRVVERAAPLQVQPLTRNVPALVALAHGLLAAEELQVAAERPGERHVESRVDEDTEVPERTEFLAQHEHTVEEEHGVPLRGPFGSVHRRLAPEVEDCRPVAPAPAGPERDQQAGPHCPVVERVVEVALRRRASSLVARLARAVETVYRSSDDAAPERGQGVREFIGQNGLPRRAYAVYRDAHCVFPRYDAYGAR